MSKTLATVNGVVTDKSANEFGRALRAAGKKRDGIRMFLRTAALEIGATVTAWNIEHAYEGFDA